MSTATYILLLALAQSFDISTTWIGLNRGCVEQVWPTQNPRVIAGVKTAGVVSFGIVFPWTQRQPSKLLRWTWRGVWVSGVASGVAGGAWNMVQLSKCGNR